ncbi:hypothetical protein TNCV_590441 [Trichonephila clavipes]|nr:hypothetical protein TNCV_590441 [Trichonephila clavipes]
MPRRHYTYTASMSPPGFKTRPKGTAVSVTDHYTGWATGNRVPYELKPQNVECRFCPYEMLLTRHKRELYAPYSN